MANNIPVDIDFILKNMNFEAEAAKMKNSIKGVTSTVKTEADQMSKIFRNVAAGIGVYFSAGFLKNFVKEVASVRGEFQQLEVSFETILKSKSKADALMAQVVDFASKTPFELKDVAIGTKQLLAYQFAAEDIIGTMRMLGDVSAGVSAPIGDLVYLYGTLRTQGRAYTRDILQFTSRGIPIIAELAKQFGVAEDKIQGMVEAGKVGFKEVEKAFQAMTSEGGIFSGLMEKQSKTITGLASNFQDAWDKMLNSIGQSNEGVIADSIKAATSLVENYQLLEDILKTLIATYGAYKAATIVNALLREAEAAGSLAKALKQTAVAKQLLNIAQKASPVGIAIAAITSLIGGYLIWEKHLNKTNSFTAELNKSISDEILSLDSLFKKLKSTEIGTKERSDAIKITNERYGDYLENLLTEKSTLQEIEIAQRNATNALIANISVQKSKDKLSEIFGEVSDKFDKEFGNFISKFGEIYGTDRIPEFVVAINDAVDKEIKAGGGQVKRGILEYSSIAKNVYDDFIKNISQKTGFLQYSFDDFKESFLDFAEFKAKKSGFIETLEGMINAYQGIIDKFSKKNSGSGDGGSSTENEQEKYTKLLKDKEKEYEAYNTAVRQLGKDWADANFQLLLKDGENFRRYLDNQVELFKGSRDKMIAISAAAQSAGINLTNPITTPITPKTIKSVGTVAPADTKTLADMTAVYKRLAAQVKLLNNEFDTEKQDQFGNSLLDTGYMFQDIAGQVSEVDAELGNFINDIAKAATNAGNLISGLATGNIFQAVSGAVGLLVQGIDGLSGSKINNIDKSLDNVSENMQRLSDIMQTLNDNNDWAIAANKQINDLNTNISTTLFQLKQIDFSKFYRDAAHPYGYFEDINTSSWNKQDFINSYINGTGGPKLSKDIDQYKLLLDALIDYQNQLNNLNEEVKTNILGFSTDDVATSLADGIIQGFKLAEGGLGDFAQGFGDLMQAYGRKALETFINEKYLQQWYDQAYSLANDNDGITEQDKLVLQTAYREMIEGAQGFYQGISSIVGATSEQTGLAGKISAATEETMSFVGGQLMALRVDVKSIIGEIVAGQENMDASLIYLRQIELNTRDISYMKSMDTRLRDMNTYLKNLGS